MNLPQEKAPEPENIQGLRRAMEEQQTVEGKVIGWNDGGLHVVVDGATAFCPRSELEIESVKKPESYLDNTYSFHVLRIQRGGKRVVLSRKEPLRAERQLVQDRITKTIQPGAVIKGKVASLTDFGAFIDLDGVQGLVHVSELSRDRVSHPSEVVEEGQEVEVKVLRVENEGRRISLSMKALQPDPWRSIAGELEEGTTVTGIVERTADFGAFIRVAPGVTGLLPTAHMAIPRDASPARAYPPGKEVQVLVAGIDSKRRRISLALEGAATEGTKQDLESYRREQTATNDGFNALAAALQKARAPKAD
ncbi:MAG: S1 RNA-binding domain-containing protein [Acidobacteriota bacterium]|nr:S1 RNA-binding domain-containing protein [Acidobacteriota bacterium]